MTKYMLKPSFKQILKMRSTAILSSILLFITQPSFAEHFHYFIDIETNFAVNQDNQLTALNVSWVYDEKMSALMKMQNPNFKALGQATINDLNKQHYFTHLQYNGKPVKTGKASKYNLQEFTENGRTALQLDFILPLQNPLNMNGNNTLTWNFTDPSGVAIMVYYNEKNIRLGNQLKQHCKASMKDNKNAEHGDPAQFLSLACSI